MTDLKQRLAAILAADAAGYSRLMSQDERATVTALDTSRSVFHAQTVANQGRVVDTAGDSVLAVFETAAGALNAALKIQAELAEFQKDIPFERRMLFRVGVHMGDVMEKTDGSVYGDGVNISARLQALAEPGQIVVSDAIHGAVRGKVAATFTDQGEQQVKNIAHPVRAYRVRIGQADEPTTASVANPLTDGIDLSLPAKPSIAVLPFTNMSGDPEQEYFTDGVTEDIITELSRFHSLFVIARNSSFSYKHKSPDVRQVGKELGVRFVLEGSIRRSGSRIRVTAQLIDAPTGNHIWAEKYDRVLEDIFAVQDEVTRSIVLAITPQIEVVEADKARKHPTSVAAYEIAVRAWSDAVEGHHLVQTNLLDRALAEAARALVVDPENVLALQAAGLGNFVDVFYRLSRDRNLALTEGLAAARLAVRIDSSSSRSHCVLGLLQLEAGQHEEALSSLRLAVDLNPNDMYSLNGLAYVEMTAGNARQAVEHTQRAIRLSPRDPLRWLMLTVLAQAYFLGRDYFRASEVAVQSISVTSSRPISYLTRAAALVGLGDIGQAREQFTTARLIAPALTESRVAGGPYRDLEQSHRYRTFLRIAAGLEDPSAPPVPI